MGKQDIYHYNLLNGFGRSAEFNGTSSVVVIPHSADLTFGNGTTDQPFSISAWVNMDDATQFRIFSKSNTTNSEYLFTGDGSDQLALILYDSAIGNTISATTTALTAYQDQDLFVVATYDGGGSETGIEVYVYDSNQTLLLSTNAQTGGTYTAMEGNSLDQAIGWWEDANSYANGTIWDVRVHNTELTASEIAALVASPNNLTGHEVSRWKLMDTDDTNDSIGANNGTGTDVTWNVKVPKGANSVIDANLSNPAGTYHNNAETYVNTNPYGSPELIYRGGIATDHVMRPDEGFVSPEFMNIDDLDAAANYALYDQNITAEQAEQVNQALSYGFTPLDLSPKLWLDATDLDNINLNSSSVFGLLDKSNQTDVLEKSFDFSSSLDGMTFGTGTKTFGESIGGVDDCLKCVAVSSAAVAGYISLSSSNTAYSCSFDIYIPSSNSTGVGIEVDNNGTWNFLQNTSIVLDSWNTITVPANYITNTAYIFRLITLGGSSTVTDGDTFYLKNVIINSLSGNHFGQGTAADQPAVDSTTAPTKITFDGVSEYLDGSANISNFTSDSQGEIVIVGANKTSGAVSFMAFADASAANLNGFGTRFSEVMATTLNSNVVYGTNVLTQNQLYILNYSSNDTSYSYYKDNSEETIVGGTNNGNWIAEVTGADTISLGASLRATPDYSNVELSEILYFSTPLTAGQRTQLYSYLKIKHDL